MKTGKFGSWLLAGCLAILLAGCGQGDLSPPAAAGKAGEPAIMPVAATSDLVRMPAQAMPQEAPTNEKAQATISALKAAPSQAGAPLFIALPAPEPAAIDTLKQNNDDASAAPKALQIGFSRTIPPAQRKPFGQSALPWVTTQDGGQTAHINVRSPDAAALRIALNISKAPAGTELRFFGSREPERILGPVYPSQFMAESPYWSPVVEGDTLTVEIYLAAGATADQLSIDIPQISHLIASPTDPDVTSAVTKLASGAGSCNYDVACHPNPSTDLQNAIRSVAKMVYSRSDGSYLCTGTLLNSQSGAAYFYSAAHCISTQTVASTLNTYWNYQRSSCGSGIASYTQLYNGAKLLYVNSTLDGLLLQLNDAQPAGSVRAGWDASIVQPAPIIAIHHPAGDYKKISYGTMSNAFTTSNDGVGPLIPVSWSGGVVEGGSSGSGLFSADAAGALYLRGGLWGGASSCSNPGGKDYYSRLDLVYPSIKQYLMPDSPSGFVPQNGWWWNPAEGGRGFTIEILNNKMFLGAYLYDQSGRATWHVSGPTAMTSSTRYEGTLLTYAGGQTLNGAWKQPTIIGGAGSVRIDFTSATKGTLTWAGGSIPIQRYDIPGGGLDAPAPAFVPERGWWWNESEGGRGFSIEVQGNRMYVAGYMYDDQGNPVWYASLGTMVSSYQYNGIWAQYANGQTLTGPWKQPSVNPNVGAISIAFVDAKHALLTFPNGRSIQIYRYLY